MLDPAAVTPLKPGVAAGTEPGLGPVRAVAGVAAEADGRKEEEDEEEDKEGKGSTGVAVALAAFDAKDSLATAASKEETEVAASPPPMDGEGD